MIYPNMLSLFWLTFLDCWILMLVLPCFLLGVKLIWFLDVFYHFEDVLYSLPCLFITFMSFLNDLLEYITWQGSREMVEGEVIFDRGHLGRITKDCLSSGHKNQSFKYRVSYYREPIRFWNSNSMMFQDDPLDPSEGGFSTQKLKVDNFEFQKLHGVHSILLHSVMQLFS